MIDAGTILDNVCDRINELRMEKGWNIKQFSDFVKIPRTTVNSWLLKKRMPKIELLYQIADSFNVTLDYLVGREE